MEKGEFSIFFNEHSIYAIYICLICVIKYVWRTFYMIDFIDLLIKTNYCPVSQCILYFRKKDSKECFRDWTFYLWMQHGKWFSGLHKSHTYTGGPWATSVTWEIVPINKLDKHNCENLWLLLREQKVSLLFRIEWSILIW